MKLSTKILIGLFVISLVPAIWLGRYFLMGIVPTDKGFSFSISTLGILGIVFMAINIILGSILYFRFLSALSLSKALFFSIMPLTVVYGVLIFLIADISQMDGTTAKSFRSLLNINDGNQYNAILWAVLISVIYISLLFLVFALFCKPLSRVEKIVSRLSDGKVKEPHFKIGGGKQFKGMEHSLNKINYNYYASDHEKAEISDIAKFIPKEALKFLGKNNISQLQLGQQVKIRATMLFCDLNGQKDQSDLSLEDNFNLLSSYMSIVTPIIKRYGGFIDKYLGDGLLAVFSHSENGLECAHQICKALDMRNKSHADKPIVDSSICLHTSDVIFGITGGQERLIPTIIGEENNFIKHIRQINDFLGSRLIFTEATLCELPTKYKLYYRYVGALKQESKKEKIGIFESLEVYGRDKREKLAQSKGEFERAVKDYEEGNYEGAKEGFSSILRAVPDDKISYVYFNSASEKE